MLPARFIDLSNQCREITEYQNGCRKIHGDMFEIMISDFYQVIDIWVSLEKLDNVASHLRQIFIQNDFIKIR